MLYVLDEHSVGLHPCDTERLLTAVRSLRDRGNSLVVVEHAAGDLAALDSIDEVIEILLFFQIRNYLRSTLRKVFFVYGPTGSGKSCLAAKTATSAGNFVVVIS